MENQPISNYSELRDFVRDLRDTEEYDEEGRRYANSNSKYVIKSPLTFGMKFTRKRDICITAGFFACNFLTDFIINNKEVSLAPYYAGTAAFTLYALFVQKLRATLHKRAEENRNQPKGTLETSV